MDLDLAGYMRKYRLTQSAMAEKLGVSQVAVGHWLAGRRRITAERARDIERRTDGEISPNRLRPDLFPRSQVAAEAPQA